MRILFLTHRIPFPPNKGDKIRSFNLLKYLAGRHEVHVASLIDDARDLKFTDDVARVAKSFVFHDISQRRRAVSALRAVSRAAPVTVMHFYSSKLQKQIDELLAQQSFDAVLCFSSPMAEYVFRSRHRAALENARVIMDLIDVDSYKWAQYAGQCSRPMRWVYEYESRRLAAYEERISRDFDGLFVVTEQERQLLPPGVSPEKVSAIGNGVDLEYFAPPVRATAAARPPTLVFTGAMDYWPNIDGVCWFVESIFPQIRQAFPEVAFQVVGSRPTQQVLDLARVPGVTVTGFVPDVRECLANADVCVVPLRIARGIQNKVLEAMAMAKPVVTTAEAYEGIRARVGEELLVAADERAFASAVIDLLGEPARALGVGRQARARVESEYSWSYSLQKLEQLLSDRVAA